MWPVLDSTVQTLTGLELRVSAPAFFFCPERITQRPLLVVRDCVWPLCHSCSLFCFVSSPLDIFASPQDCGLELNDEDGHRCYPLEDHLFCHSCHIKRLEKGHSSTALHQHHF